MQSTCRISRAVFAVPAFIAVPAFLAVSLTTSPPSHPVAVAIESTALLLFASAFMSAV